MLTKLNNILQIQFQKNIDNCTNEELYIALLRLVKALSKNRSLKLNENYTIFLLNF